MREMFLVAVTQDATEDTTPMVLPHRRRHLLPAGEMPSPADAVAILLGDPDRGHFLDGVPIRDHHAAGSIPCLFPLTGSLPNSGPAGKGLAVSRQR